ncbi:hypothetical protein [Chryseobacterium profundimaris]|uniref:Peptide methionine sulfoxide reductase n=1 Tax=Chryseobacterium profundimaris TaxID=1387275 RepID=A0ABY1PIH2_9FLAO|nr:hypothetical protein [Chryseobacterium profundimaris]SMP33515.1 hypothetical protein SAMN06264346_11631 [Chryseobacterium profundimaris]
MTKEEIEEIKNLRKEEFSGAAFKVTVLTVPELCAKYFETNTPKVYVLGYKGKEGQLGYIENCKFIPYEGDDIVIKKIALDIFEVLLLNSCTGHFIRK